MNQFRRREGIVLSDFLEGLHDPSATFAHATVQMLKGIARADDTTASERRQILAKLRDVYLEPGTIRPVYAQEYINGTTRLRYLDRLDKAIFEAILEITKS